jgi:hypothetical protein
MIDPPSPPLMVVTKFNFLNFLKPQRLQYYFQKGTEVRPESSAKKRYNTLDPLPGLQVMRHKCGLSEKKLGNTRSVLWRASGNCFFFLPLFGGWGGRRVVSGH